MASKNGSSSSSVVGNYLTKEEASTMISSSINNAINIITVAYNNGIDVINSIPGMIQSSTLKVTEALGVKLQSIGDAVKGSDPNRKEDNEYVSILKIHYDMLEKLRKQDIIKYRKLVEVCRKAKGQPDATVYVELKKHFDEINKPLKQE